MLDILDRARETLLCRKRRKVTAYPVYTTRIVGDAASFLLALVQLFPLSYM